MDQFVDSIVNGAAMAIDPWFLLIMAIATLWGIVAGSLPGLSASLAVGVAISFTFFLTPAQAVGSLLAILVGVNYGNSLPAVVLGVPGTPSAVLTAREGYQMHQRGEGATALGVTYVASLVGQSVSIVFFIALVIPLAQLAYLFLAPEFFAMTILALSAVIGLAGRSILKALLAGSLGLAVAFIGRDPINFAPRFTAGFPQLRDGFEVIPVVIGLLAVSELIRSTRQVFSWTSVYNDTNLIRFPPLSVIRRCLPSMGIGTIVGTIMGVLPGAGADAAAYLSYQQAKTYSKHPEEFGHGSVEGIAANEAAQNACQAGDLIPTLAVGIPGSATMVLILAAVAMHGLIPGPLLLTSTPSLLYGSVGGLLVSTVILAAIGWPIARATFWITTLDRSIVTVCALALVVVGVFTLRQSLFDVGVALAFGGIGYFMIRYDYSVAAAALALILGQRMEATLRQGILLSDGSFWSMVTRPITATILAIAVAALAFGVYSEVRNRRIVGATPNHT